MNRSVNQHLAIEYHLKRVKRFSETFFVKDFGRKQIINTEPTENYQHLNEYIRQSDYFQSLPNLTISCDDIDGLPEQIPIIFEENYFTFNDCCKFSNTKIPNDYIESTSKIISESESIQSDSSTHSINKNINKRLKKKIHSSIDILSESNHKQPITLVSYKKNNDDFADNIDLKLVPKNLSSNDHKIKISQIKADLNKEKETEKKHSEDLFPITTHDSTQNFSSGENILLSENNINYRFLKEESTKIRNEFDDSLSELENKLSLHSNKSLKEADKKFKLVSDEFPIQHPVDFSLKSRVLYESFRGRTNTLERKPVEKKIKNFTRNVLISNKSSSNQPDEEIYKFLQTEPEVLSSFLNSKDISVVNNGLEMRKSEKEIGEVSLVETKRELSSNELVQEKEYSNNNEMIRNNLIGESLYK